MRTVKWRTIWGNLGDWDIDYEEQKDMGRMKECGLKGRMEGNRKEGIRDYVRGGDY